MSDKPNQGAKDPVQPDVLEPVADDAPEDNGAPSEPAAEPATAEERDALELDTSGADRRAAIAKRYRDKRREPGDVDSIAAAPAEEAADDAGDAGEGDAEETVSDAPPQQEKQFTLKVDGREIKKSESEVLALAQMYEAGHSRLETSKEVLGAIKALRDQITAANQRGTGESDAQSRPDPSQAASPSAAEADAPDLDVSLEELEGIVDRVQTGDVKEGAAALGELLARNRKALQAQMERQRPATDVRTAVAQELSETRVKSEITSAVIRFAEEYPEINNEPLIYSAMGMATREELVNELKAVGARDEDLALIKDDAKKLATAHEALRQQGHKLRSYGEILDSAATKIGQKFNMKFASKAGADDGARSNAGGGKTPAAARPTAAAKPGTPQRIVANPAEVQRRLDQKRQVQQPKTAGGRAPVEQGQRPKTRSEIVAEARKARHFPVSR